MSLVPKLMGLLSILSLIAVELAAGPPDLPVAASSLEAAIRESEKKFVEHFPPPTPEALEVIRDLEAVAQTTGQGPTDQAMLASMAKREHKWSIPDLRHIWLAFSHLQKPRYTTADILDAFKATRKKIETIHVKYRVTSERNKRKSTVTCEFALDGNKVLFFEGKPGGAAGDWKTASIYDGELFTHYYTEEGDFRHGAVTKVSERDRFFGRNNPLGLTMALDSVRDLGAANGAVDVVTFMQSDLAFNGVVREVLEEREGVPCVVAGSLNQRIYLDPARNFAVLGFDDVRYQYDKGTGQVTESRNWTERRNSDLFDAGNGFWLPRKSETMNWSEGVVAARDTVELTDVVFNKPLAKSVFTFDFPKGAYVTDHVRGITYQKGFDPSVEATLRGAVVPLEASRQSLRGWLIAINVAVVALLIAYAVYRRRGLVPKT